MTLLRRTARTLLASYFVVNGVKAVRNPETVVPIAQPFADKVVPRLKQYAPQVGGYVPEDARTLVRANAAVQLGGGLALASGKGRRLGAALLAGSLIPSTIAKHPFWAQTDPQQKASEKAEFLKNGSLLGGLLIASGDTEGKPSLAWRAQKAAEITAKSTKTLAKGTGTLAKGTKTLAKGTGTLAKGTGALAKGTAKGTSSLARGTAKSTGSLLKGTVKGTSALAKGGQQAAGSALASGATLASAVAATSRRARKLAEQELEQTRKTAGRRAAAAAPAREAAKKDAKRSAKAAEKKRGKRAAARQDATTTKDGRRIGWLVIRES